MLIAVVPGCGLTLDLDPADPKNRANADAGRPDAGERGDGAGFDAPTTATDGSALDAHTHDAVTALDAVTAPDAIVAADADRPDALDDPYPPTFGDGCMSPDDCRGGLCRTTMPDPFCYETACTAACTTDEECSRWVFNRTGMSVREAICFDGECDLTRSGLGIRVCE